MGVEHLAGDAQVGGQAMAGAAVGGVADDRMSEAGHVNADLMGAAGFDAHAQERGEGAGGEGFVAGEGGAAFFRDGHFLAVDGMAADGEIDRAGGFGRGAPHEGEVFLLDGVGGELGDEGSDGLFVLGDDEDAGGVFVEAMDDAGAEFAADAGEIGAVVEKSVDEGVGGVAGGGVDDEAGGFVEDDEVGVFVEDVEGDVGGEEADGFGGREGAGEGVAGGEGGVGFEGGGAVEGDAAGFDELFPAGAGDGGVGGGEPGVEAGGERRGLEREDFLRVLAARKPTGIFSAPARRGRPLASRPRKGVGTARVVRNAPSSENLPVISAKQPRQNPQEILCCHVLRTANR